MNKTWYCTGAHCLQIVESFNAGDQQATSRSTPALLLGMSADQRRWVERFRQNMHVCGVGEGSQQVRERHVALVDTCISGWDKRWESKLAAAETVLKPKGVLPVCRATYEPSASFF